VPAIPGSVEVSLAVPVAAPRDRAFRALTDWAAQGRWMTGTSVSVTRGDGTAAGDEISGFTGLRLAGRRIGLLDTMDIVAIDDEWVLVRKTGRLLRGVGWMGVPKGGPVAVLVWGGRWILPLGPLGRAGWALGAPVVRAGLRRSLTRLAELVEAGELGAPAPDPARAAVP
jgi:hypothetical protein